MRRRSDEIFHREQSQEESKRRSELAGGRKAKLAGGREVAVGREVAGGRDVTGGREVRRSRGQEVGRSGGRRRSGCHRRSRGQEVGRSQEVGRLQWWAPRRAMWRAVVNWASPRADRFGPLKLGLPDNKCGSRILFTTRNRLIASTHGTHARDRDSSDFRHPSRFIFLNEPLSEQDAWTLFCKKAFQGEREDGIWSRSCPPELEDLSRKILQRCEGLPLAIGAVGGLLSRKGKTLVEWERVHRSLAAEMEEDESEMVKVKMMLSLSYDALPYHLKSCFLYLGIFPELSFIGRRRVIRLWIAEGFVQEKVGKTPEEVADDYLGEIMACSLMQVAEYYDHGSARSYRLHDFIREIILSKSRQERFGTFSTRKPARSSTISSSTGTDQYPFHKIRRLSIQNDFQSILPGKNERFSHLRSLFMFGIGNSTAAGVGIFPGRIGSLSSFRLLKVLDMEDAPIERFPSEIGSLFHLRYLSLKGTKISSVSKSLGKLQNLQTLNLKETQVSELPVEINMLEQLRDLLVYRYVDQPFQYVIGFKVPSDKTIMGKLRCLRTPAFLELDDQGASFIKELATLTQLRRLAVTKLKNPDGPGLCARRTPRSRLSQIPTSPSPTTVSQRSARQAPELDSIASEPRQGSPEIFQIASRLLPRSPRTPPIPSLPGSPRTLRGLRRKGIMLRIKSVSETSNAPPVWPAQDELTCVQMGSDA
ncbi:hypothetical protein H6P81_002777 [Aristolochia fimbriata]|uniref:NB-ARC domain-containing protein n=1 Tax=Aristolochia fimbriata TaxID=158543 RepID=A0AAV7FCD8_ARIFI|nr:hypothetical protein H6P81_002777 [Aristolochia fimbriata]